MSKRVVAYYVGENIIGSIGSRSVKPYKTLWKVILHETKYKKDFEFEVAKINVLKSDFKETFYGKPVLKDSYELVELEKEYLY